MRSLFALIPLLLFSSTADAARTKDLGSFHGIREVSLTGLGLVTGLQQTGDTQINRATVRAMIGDLAADGLVLDERDLMSRNAALVRLTATMRSDGRIGTRVDIRVASLGDARSLEGGVLEPSFMRAVGFPDLAAFQVLAQGPLTVGGFNVEADGNQSRRNVTNVGIVSDGGSIERELPPAFAYNELESIDFLLAADNRDFTTAMRLADAVNESFGTEIAEPVSAAAVRIQIPEEYRGKFARFAATVEQVELDPDAIARVVIDARTGTVVLGGKIGVRPFAIAHGGLKIEVGVDRQASQPGAFSPGETVVVENTFIGVDEEQGELVLINAVSLADLVSALNAMGVKPRDLVVILQAVKDAGALDAELVLR
ncbi:MAG: flagellar basal body P-ring protein FlgI [Myxococcota bacterium]